MDYCDICINSTYCYLCTIPYYSKIFSFLNKIILLFCLLHYFLIYLSLVTIDGNSPICIASCPSTGYFVKTYFYTCVAFAYSNCLAPDKDTGCTNSTCCTKATCGTAVDYASRYNYCVSDCGTGYFMDTYLTNFKKCTRCSTNCLTCSSLNVCTSCTGT